MRIIMKKKTTLKTLSRKVSLCTLLACTALGCAACSSGTQDTSDSGTEEKISAEDTQNAGNNALEQEDGNLQPDTDGAPENDAETASPETDITVSNVESNIAIEMKEETHEKSAEDGTVYLTRGYAYPIVTIEGNNDAAEKINTDIRARIDSFLADTAIEEWAKSDYDAYSASSENEDEEVFPFLPYSEDLTFKVARSDSNVISFIATYSSFTGGAHGNFDTRGINYSAKTGEPIIFTDLSEDSVAFREDTLSYNQKLAETESYQERMFSEESITDGTLESVLYADDVWYLSTSGLVFMSAPYALGPYAEGNIEFIIPYSDLADMGFKEIYSYTDRMVLKLQNKASYSYDLNGDGQEDSFRFYTDYVEGDDGLYNTVLHLIINDTDLTQDDSLGDLTDDLSWAELSLYDLNVDDSYLELVFLSGVSEGDDYVYYSYFYRYTQDGSLLYLGKTKGDVTDPTVKITDLVS